VHIVNLVSPSGKWQQLQQQMCAPPHRKHDSTWLYYLGSSPDHVRSQVRRA
jgi:hypothetical protein